MGVCLVGGFYDFESQIFYLSLNPPMSCLRYRLTSLCFPAVGGVAERKGQKVPAHIESTIPILMDWMDLNVGIGLISVCYTH